MSVRFRIPITRRGPLPLACVVAIAACRPVPEPPRPADQGGRGTLTPFASDTAVEAYLAEILPEYRPDMPQGPPCSRLAALSTSAADRQAADSAKTVIAGLVADDDGHPLEGAMVLAVGSSASAITDKAGQFVLRLPPDSQRVVLHALYIGREPALDSVDVAPADSVNVEIALCSAVALGEIAVAVAEAPSPSVTNVQTAGVDEGGIVKLAGRFLVILRRGRLFTVDIGSGQLRPVAARDAFGPGLNASGDWYGTWYDEMLVSGNRVVVIGFSYERGGTELGIFELDDGGGISWLGTWHLRSNDYYSSRNYAARLVGSRLVVYTPEYLRWRRRGFMDAFPGLRRWDPADSAGRFTPIWTARRVFKPARPVPGHGMALHSVMTCDLAAPLLACEASVVIGPESRNFYVSPTAVYVWMTSWDRGDDSTTMVVRMPLDGNPPTALGTRGSPVDQFSFLESGDGYLNVFLTRDPWGDAMWQPERGALGGGALLRAPLDRFGNGSLTAPTSWYRRLPTPGRGPLTNRFVGEWLLYGRGSGWGSPRAEDTWELIATRWQGGRVHRVQFEHPADRIEVMSTDAVVVGASAEDLHFTGIHLADQPAVAQRFILPDAAEGETRSHGFFYRVDGPDEGIIGLPIAQASRERWRHLIEGSASVLFLRNEDRQFRSLGELDASAPPRARDDACKASCVDWYGNARPLFIGSRVFALLGYELVEGTVDGEGVRETRRVDFTPSLTR